MALTDADRLQMTALALMRHSVWESYLLEGYTPKNYIESSGAQYINTGFVPDANTSIEISFRKSNTTYGDIFGSGTDYPAELGICMDDGSRIGCFYAGVDSGWVSTVANAYSYDHILKTSTNKFYSLGSLKHSGSGTPSITHSIYIFACNYSNGVYSNISMKLYYMKIWNDTTLARYFIPAVRDSDSVAGLFDLITHQFYTNAGTGSFTAG